MPDPKPRHLASCQLVGERDFFFWQERNPEAEDPRKMCNSNGRASLILGPKDTPVTLKLRRSDGTGEVYMVTALRHVLIDEWVRSETDIRVKPSSPCHTLRMAHSVFLKVVSILGGRAGGHWTQRCKFPSPTDRAASQTPDPEPYALSALKPNPQTLISCNSCGLSCGGGSLLLTLGLWMS